MSVGPLPPVAAGASGTTLAQAKGADLDRAQQESASYQRRVQAEQRADNAAGIGQADGEDHESSERDADGRRPWEIGGRSKPPTPAGSEPSPPLGKDPTGQTGTLLDLSG